jgi:hypothetical protein
MGQFSDSDLPLWTTRRILGFFNRANTEHDLTEGILQDDPGTGTGKYAIGKVVAQRILDRRNVLPGRRFVSITQLNGIQGLGEDKFHDLVYTFQLPAALAFRESLYANLMDENWQIDNHTIHWGSRDEFMEVVEDPQTFHSWLAEELGSLAAMRFGVAHPTAEACKRLDTSALTTYTSGHLGAYALALWFYNFDQDNWFSFEEMLAETNLYLDFMPFMEERIELRFFHGFENQDLLVQGLSVRDLPVVVNYSENSVTIWSAHLLD